MMRILGWLVLQAGLYALIAPGIVGLLDWFRARLQARRGAAPWQPYWDLVKLLRKWPNIARSTSWVFSAAPPIVFACYLSLGLFLPVSFFGAPVGGAAAQVMPGIDFILVIYLLGLARFVAGLAAFDVAALFGTMSSGRQMFFHALTEPTLFVAIYALAQAKRTTEVAKLVVTTSPPDISFPALAFILLSLSIVFLAESGHLPFDNPHTNLELTMVEQGTHLAYNGRALALLEWAHAMKLTFFLFLLSDLMWPVEMAVIPLKLLFLLLVLAFWDAAWAKLRLRQVVGPFAVALVLALVAALFVMLAAFAQRG